MSDIVTKLKASTPNIVGEEASAYYDRAYSGRDPENSRVYHSTVHGFDNVVNIIDNFIKTHSKVGPSDTEFIYSYQPYLIGRFSVSDESVKVDIWYMLYSNCVIAYYEAETSAGPYKDISMVVNATDLEEILNGP
jgi:hypothetical protein